MAGTVFMMLLQWAAVAVVLFAFVKIIGTAIYRVHDHPLSGYPGPFLAKISDLWSVYYNIRGETHRKVQGLHRRYGPVVRLGPNKLSINSVTAVQEAYHSDVVYNTEVYRTLLPAECAYNAFTAMDEKVHGQERQIPSHAFSNHALRAFEPTISNHTRIFLDDLSERIPRGFGWSQPMNMTPIIQRYVTDIMGDFGFGKSFDFQKGSENDFVIEAINGTSSIAAMHCQHPKLNQHGLGKLISLAGIAIKEQFSQSIRQPIVERFATPGKGRTNILNFLTSSNAQGDDAQSHEPPASATEQEKKPPTQSLTQDEIRAETRTPPTASSAPISAAIAATLFHLSQHPSRLARLTCELRETPKSSSEASARATPPPSSPYLRACIDETLRISPPVATMLWRRIGGGDRDGEDLVLEIDGADHARRIATGDEEQGRRPGTVSIPRGTDVGFSPYTLHRNPEIFPDPESWVPERWVGCPSTSPSSDAASAEDEKFAHDGQEEESARLAAMRRAFLPFGLGRGKCVGIELAYAEIGVCVAETLRRFDVRRAEGKADTKEAGGTEGGFRTDCKDIAAGCDEVYLELRERRAGEDAGVDYLLEKEFIGGEIV